MWGGMPRYKTKAPNLDPYLNYLQKEYNSKYEMRTQKRENNQMQNHPKLNYIRDSFQKFLNSIFQGEQVEKSSNVRSI